MADTPPIKFDFREDLARMVSEVSVRVDAAIRANLMAAGWAPPEIVEEIRDAIDGAKYAGPRILKIRRALAPVSATIGGKPVGEQDTVVE